MTLLERVEVLVAEQKACEELAVNVISGLSKARAPVNLDEAIRAACERRGGHHPGAGPLAAVS